MASDTTCEIPLIGGQVDDGARGKVLANRARRTDQRPVTATQRPGGPQGPRPADDPGLRRELEHHFLWRVRLRLSPPGIVGVFDRSHYEDVVVVRVHELVPPQRWSRRYDVINRFEEKLTAAGTRMVKCFLHISKEEQRKRLMARLDDPTKRWKYDPDDVDQRAYWNDYQQAYADTLKKCNSEVAPWYVVPADHKWYRNWAITRILVEQLEEMALTWPVPEDWDPEEQRARLTGHPKPAPQ